MTFGASTGVVLMTFGAAASLDDIPAYLRSVRGGLEPPVELIAEFRRRYEAVGGSPLVQITRSQAAALETLLNTQENGEGRHAVRAGMRHTPPFISDAVQELASTGANRLVGVILAPQHSPLIMAGYHRAFDEAAASNGVWASARVAGAWHTVPSFLDGLSGRLVHAIAGLPPGERDSAPVLFTAHSLPKSVAEKESQYIEMLRDTAQEMARRAGLPPDRWQFAYQSAGHTPEEWLTPDIKDLFPLLRGAGHRTALVAPVQFVSDHLEVLYDIDVEARHQAQEAGLQLVRTEMLNARPEFIRALADVVLREATEIG